MLRCPLVEGFYDIVTLVTFCRRDGCVLGPRQLCKNTVVCYSPDVARLGFSKDRYFGLRGSSQRWHWLMNAVFESAGCRCENDNNLKEKEIVFNISYCQQAVVVHRCLLVL